MARIKPKTLLLQSKMKKGPTRTIITCNLVVGLIVLLSLVAIYRHWSPRTSGQIGHNSLAFENDDAFTDSSKSDLPGYAILNTSKGYIVVELYKEGSPETVDKFLDLCQKGHFKGMPFYRVIKNYVIQGGHSKEVETAGDWILKVKPHNISPKHEAFMLGTPKVKQDGKGFELFITTAPLPNLNDKLTVFGRVVKGEDVVQEIEEVDTDEHYRPKSHVMIVDVTLKHTI